MNNKNRIQLFLLLSIFVLLLFSNQELKAQQRGCALLYQHTPSSSVPHLYCGTTYDVLGNNDNEYSTMKIGPDTECILTEHPRFAGKVFRVKAGPRFSTPVLNSEYRVIELPPGNILDFSGWGWDNFISSVACMPSGYFDPGNVYITAIELFEHGWFAGKILREVLPVGTGRISRSSIPGWDNQITSIRIGRGVQCVFYEHPNYKGDRIVFPQTGRWYAFPFLGPQWNDKISSYTCFRLSQ